MSWRLCPYNSLRYLKCWTDWRANTGLTNRSYHFYRSVRHLHHRTRRDANAVKPEEPVCFVWMVRPRYGTRFMKLADYLACAHAPTHTQPLIKGSRFTPSGARCKSLWETGNYRTKWSSNMRHIFRETIKGEREKLNDFHRITSGGCFFMISGCVIITIIKHCSARTGKCQCSSFANSNIHHLFLFKKEDEYPPPITPLSVVDCSEKEALCNSGNSDFCGGK